MPVIPLREEARGSEVQGHPLSPSMVPSWSGLQETPSQKHAKEHNNVDNYRRYFLNNLMWEKLANAIH